jgi:transcription-repair coupling factor (superfamily II helicase)
VAAARAGATEEAAEAAEEWTPQIQVGTSVLIPDSYVADLGVRLGLYRRISQLVDRREIDAFAAELIDRFGPLPPEVENLLEIITIKRLCRDAGVEKLDAGPKGAVLGFRNNEFANPGGLIGLIQKNAGTLKVRPDQRLVYARSWETPKERVAGVTKLMQALAKLARQPAKDPPAMPPTTSELVKRIAASRGR